MASFKGAGGGGAGGGILYPDSAARPFSSNSARNTWANNNKQDLIKDTTVVNVGGSQWYLWTGESNPQTVQTSLWMDANLIVQGEKGDQGDAGVSVTNAQIDANDDSDYHACQMAPQLTQVKPKADTFKTCRLTLTAI